MGTKVVLPNDQMFDYAKIGGQINNLHIKACKTHQKLYTASKTRATK